MLKTLSTVFAAFLIAGMANGQFVVIDDAFGDGNPETNTDGTVAGGIDGTYGTFESQPGVTLTESSGALKFDPSAAGNWARAEFLSKNDFPFPEAGETRTFNWTIGPVTPSSDVGADDYRIQFNATNSLRAQETEGGSERWVLDGDVSGASAISLDLYFEKDNIANENGAILAQLFEKDSAFPASNNGEQIDDNFTIGGADAAAEWRFWEDPNTFSLTLSDTGYTWSDSVTGFEFSTDYFGETKADFADGYWAYTHGQNRDGGRGFHEMSRFTVDQSNEPIVEGLACDFTGAAGCDIEDLNALYAGTDGAPALSNEAISTWLTQASAANNPLKADAAHAYVIGDANLDGSVDSTDLGLLLNNFGSDSGQAWGAGNLNDDANIDSTDLGLLLNNFGATSASSAAAVPEPSGWSLSVVFALALLSLMRRKQV